MTKKQFRLLVLLLAHRRIKFTWSRNNGVYQLAFEQYHVGEIRRAVGD